MGIDSTFDERSAPRNQAVNRAAVTIGLLLACLQSSVHSNSIIFSALETSNFPGCSTLMCFTTPSSTIMANR